MFWGIGLTGAKAASDDLVAAMKAFNARLNIEFSELRKKHSFELLLIAIHPRFDIATGLFDLHAHFICRVPPEHREAAHRRLMSKFSKIDLNTNPIRNPAAVATYMLWGIWRNEVMLSWPDHALKAAWSLAQHRFRLFRTGGAFAKWRACRRSAPEMMAKGIDKEKLRKNRQETAYIHAPVKTGDRLLSKVMVRYGEKKVAALLFEICPIVATSNFEYSEKAKDTYTSASIRITQGQPISTNTNIVDSTSVAISSVPATAIGKSPCTAISLVILKMWKSLGNFSHCFGRHWRGQKYGGAAFRVAWRHVSALFAIKRRRQ
ncbi:MAG: hypothetical protein VR78_17780 [Hoeflea sp. BRH_c9]|nr:MAG: hypothetical protein VR78_17780 [Hoeflea sp. BRH_c9]